jgi:hypothetical protein
MDPTTSEIIVIFIVSIGVYFLPVWAAWAGHKRNIGAIGLLTFFLGWTVIGWVVALIWAVTKDAPAQQVVIVKEAVAK